MKLVIILICLGLERYASIGSLLQRFTWFGSYVTWLRRTLTSESLWRGMLGVSVVIAPILIIFAIIYFTVNDWLYGMLGFLISVFILLYCLGPNDLYHQLQQYFSAVDNKDLEQQAALQKSFLGSRIPKETDKANRAMTTAIFTKANERLFAVLFWFVLFGPLGAIFYRVLTLLRKKAEQTKTEFQTIVSAIQGLHALCDWVPVRLTTLVYTLVGNFTASFSYWIKHAIQGLKSSQKLLTKCSLLALGIIPDNTTSTIEENRNAMFMIDRALVVVLFIIAIFTLGAWIA